MDIKRKNKLGKNIQKARERKKLTQDKLAHKVGIPCSSLSKIEQGYIKQPSVFVVAEIANALKTSVNKLIK